MEPQSPATNQAPAKTPVESVPSSWPGAFGIFKHSRKAVLLNIWPLVGLFVIYIAVSAVFGSIGKNSGDTSMSSGPGDFITFLIGALIDTAIVYVLLSGVRGAKMDIGAALKMSLPLYFKVLVLNILSAVIAVISLLLLVVPFFIVVPRLQLAMYFLVDQKLGPVEALKASWEATKGNVGKVWGIYGAMLVMALLIFVLVGVYFLVMYSAVFAVLYAYITSTNAAQSTVDAPTTETPALQQ